MKLRGSPGDIFRKKNICEQIPTKSSLGTQESKPKTNQIDWPAVEVYKKAKGVEQKFISTLPMR